MPTIPPIPPPSAARARRRSRAHRIAGSGGVRLFVYEWGNPAGRPILFLHGFTQNGLAWGAQAADPRLTGEYRLIAPDLRGHGASEKPAEADCYTDGRHWAGDIAAIIGALGLRRPLLVGWSYGCTVIGDYLRRHGDTALAGTVLVGGSTQLGTEAAKAFRGPAMRHMAAAFAEDFAIRLEGTRAFLSECTAQPLPAEALDTILAGSMEVPPTVRRAMYDRVEDYDPIWRQVRTPVLIAHGTEDRVKPVAAAEHAARLIANAELSIYEGCGHAVPFEAADRFNRELAAFVQRTA